jgi:hypothetical protein
VLVAGTAGVGARGDGTDVAGVGVMVDVPYCPVSDRASVLGVGVVGVIPAALATSGTRLAQIRRDDNNQRTAVERTELHPPRLTGSVSTHAKHPHR